ncbi:hypothetical protein THAOC_26862, partial [Thalassiosira oceanica]
MTAGLGDRSARSAWKVAHSKAPGPGITERASEGPGKARKARIRRKFDSSLRQRVPFIGKRDLDGVVRTPRIVSWGQTDEVVGFGRKVASRKALVELYKSLSIDDFRSPELALQRHNATTPRKARDDSEYETKTNRLPRRLEGHPAHCGDVPKTDAAPAGGGRAKKKDTRRTAAAAAGARGMTDEGGGASSGDRVVSSIDPPGRDVIPPRLASGGRRRSPSGLALLESYEEVPAGARRLLSPLPRPEGTEGGRTTAAGRSRSGAEDDVVLLPPPCLRRTGPLALRARSAVRGTSASRPRPRPTPPSSSPPERVGGGGAGPRSGRGGGRQDDVEERRPASGGRRRSPSGLSLLSVTRGGRRHDDAPGRGLGRGGDLLVTAEAERARRASGAVRRRHEQEGKDDADGGGGGGAAGRGGHRGRPSLGIASPKDERRRPPEAETTGATGRRRVSFSGERPARRPVGLWTPPIDAGCLLLREAPRAEAASVFLDTAIGAGCILVGRGRGARAGTMWSSRRRQSESEGRAAPSAGGKKTRERGRSEFVHRERLVERDETIPGSCFSSNPDDRVPARKGHAA